ncbi:hypothetical protein DSO57_1010426 [Entomophthora muscae]|uniref:Uncharacterized protein n=1 Tax=Entomophthora muscae TaxID=34485 RepID=A0ACC2S8L7_9FUNG|nr:hypothetical protein DSO57_1010426 [Entomophthora muscae]
MTPPLTPRPNCPQESVAANESTSTQIFGVMYITLTVLIDSMLAPILWWALPFGPVGFPPASSQEPPTGWIPDRELQLATDVLCNRAKPPQTTDIAFSEAWAREVFEEKVGKMTAKRIEDKGDQIPATLQTPEQTVLS